MKKNNKKGFTIVELVIVIAVIAILAGVLIPTFSGIVEKAQKSSAEQQFMNAYKEALAEVLADDGVIDANENEFIGGKYYVSFTGGSNSNAKITIATASNSNPVTYTKVTDAANGVSGYLSAVINNGAITVSNTPNADLLNN